MHRSKEWCILDEIQRYSAKKPPMKWECSSECKILSDSDVCQHLFMYTVDREMFAVKKCSPLAQVAKILRAKISRAQTARAIFARLIFAASVGGEN